MFQSSAKIDPTPYNGTPYIAPVAAPLDTGGPVSINYSLAQASQPSDKSFTIGICTVGNTLSCLYSFMFPYCAAASARSYLDGSDFCLNMTHLNPIMLRWITRSAYNIEGSSFDDLIYGLFLPCCTINQVLQTTSVYGRPYPGTGKENNSIPFVSQNNKDCCFNCLYASCCLPCAIGTSLNNSMGMPFWMGCLCSNYCIARNLVRYQYRLQGHDCWEECITPYGVILAACIASGIFPCAEFFICPYFISMVMMMLSVSRDRGNPDSNAAHGSYLHPLPPHIIMGTMFPSGAAYSVPHNQSVAAVYTTATVQPAPVVTTTAAYAPYTPSSYPLQQTPAFVTGVPPPYPANGGVPVPTMPMQTQPVIIPYPTSTPSYQPGAHIGIGVASQPRY